MRWVSDASTIGDDYLSLAEEQKLYAIEPCVRLLDLLDEPDGAEGGQAPQPL
ncbi:hypothetical protein O4328_28650 [Rhodococcus opacus]|uniref:Uncharacterized protein n=1 Tax=Rhodococcus opacus TaxID=37919 RepID=A0AAX3YQI2_RHOOP|nr:hypothetical protein [Rhodococcus opacus]MCZ4587610.1 hypothetical protein [Rhodococcus opacus]WLF51395.1 hypothetical protein Q5707_37615 [Rhodococcus opacus]